MNILMIRYILEVEQDPTLLQKYGNGWYPNLDQYRLFLKKQQKNNQNFAKLIQRYRLVKKEDHLVETIFSSDLESISDFLEKDATKIFSGYGTISISNVLPEFLVPTCYISNGFFHDTEFLALKLVENGNFVVGVCDQQNSVFYQENMQKMNEFEKTLRKKHIPYKKYRNTQNRDTKAEVITYRREAL